MKIELDYTPFPKQAAFHRSPAKFKLYSGGFGSGKTTALAYEALLYALEYPGTTGMIARQSYRELMDTTMKEFFDICPPELIRNFNKSNYHLTLWNGSIILFRNLDNLQKRRGTNLGWIAIDELSEVSESMWLELQGRLRQKNSPRKMFACTNPNGHSWVWTRWIRDAAKNKDYHIVQSATQDNPYLPADYVQSLIDNYPEPWVKRYVFGSWDAAAGIIYEELDYDKHIIKPFPIPPSWTRLRGMDYGYTNPTAVVWLAIDPDTGKVYAYDEHYAAKLTVSQHKTVVHAKTGHARIQVTAADPSMWRAADGDGRSIADEFMSGKERLPLIKANNSVAWGINKVKELLQHDRLYIFKTMENLVSEIQDYRYQDIPVHRDVNAPERPVKKDDHGCDALRYGCSYIIEHNLAPTSFADHRRSDDPKTQLAESTRRMNERSGLLLPDSYYESIESDADEEW